MDIVGLELGFLLWQVSQTNRVAASGGKWLFFGFRFRPPAPSMKDDTQRGFKRIKAPT